MLDQTPLIHNIPWINLVLLDACRYDAFEQVYREYLSGELTKVRSPASCTRDWLRRTWTQDYRDISYISCNMFMQSQNSDHPHQYEPREKFRRIIDVWKEGLMPENIEKYALTIRGRKVLHYNFPHQPYYGKPNDKDWDGYIANLRYILKYLVWFLPKLRGLTVITSDHGEILEPGMVYHPCSKDEPRLREVPWLFNAKPLNV